MTKHDDNKPDAGEGAADEPTNTESEAASRQETDSVREETDSASSGGSEPAPDESPAVEPEPAGGTAKRQKPPRKRPARGGGRRWFWLWPLLVLVLLAALAGGGYWGYEQYRQVTAQWQEVAGQQSAMREQLGSLSSQLDSAAQARESLARELRNEQARLEDMLVETAQNLSRRQDLESDRWPLEEALALLRLAERRLQLDQSAEAAIRLLDAADQVLAGLTQAAVLPVRRQIAEDRLALQSIETPDVIGLYFRLEAVGESLASQQWSPEQRVTPESQPEPDTAWDAFTGSLGSLVTITRLETPHRAPPLLDDFTRWQQHSRLLTEQVQLALLSGNQPLYDAALEQLIDRVSIMRQELNLGAVLDELDNLTGVRLTPDLPDIHGSTAALEDYMARTEANDDQAAGTGAETEGEAE